MTILRAMYDDSVLVAQMRELESQLTHLQRHVEQQDREMMAMGDRIRRLESELKITRLRIGSLEEGSGGGAPANEKPPHY